MPTEYKRKGNVSRGEWTEQELISAMEAVQHGTMGVREATRNFRVPYTTLRRRLRNNSSEKPRLGPSSTLGPENEAKLVTHIKKLQKFGFSPTRTIVRSMAFELAEKLNLPHKFNVQKRLAGYPWLESFLRRNKGLAIRKSEGVSAARSLGMNRDDVRSYFTLLENTLIESDLMDKPGHIYNVDESGLQLNNRPGYVIAEKGSRNVAAVTSGEKGETISIIACCNAEGSFIPPTCIFKGKNRKPEFEDGMPPGSKVFMGEKSAYVNNPLFLKWLKEQFVPRKPPGPVLIILDGHSSHCSSVETLEYAAEHQIIFVCLPSHTTQFLQPLDRGVFKSLKSFYYEECNAFMRRNPNRRINRAVFGQLLAAAWEQSATVKNAVSAFKATGIVPFNPSAIPDYAYLTDNTQEPAQNEYDIDNQSGTDASDEDEDNLATPRSIESSRINVENLVSLPSTSAGIQSPQTPQNDTPGKLLDQINPVPVTEAVTSARKRSRQLASVLTSEDNIQLKKKKLEEKSHSEAKKKEKRESNKRNVGRPARQAKSRKRQSSSSESEREQDAIVFEDTSDYEDESNKCVSCGEEYDKTTKSDDWIKCINCLGWLHEGCTKFVNVCDVCGKMLYKKK